MGTAIRHEMNGKDNQDVSIQLMSPASGDLIRAIVTSAGNEVTSFHSINVPSEWGPKSIASGNYNDIVSIQLMSPASGDWRSRR